MAKTTDKEGSASGYAVVETGGKQYLLKVNDKVNVELLDVKTGDKIDLKPVLAFSDGSALQIGQPEVKNAKVSCTVISEQIKGRKVVSFKKKRRKGYAKKKGHRQKYAVLKVDSIS